MNAKKAFGFLTGLVLLTLMFCPYMEAATQPKAESNCHSEPASPANENLHSCCDNDAIPVQQFHIFVSSNLLPMLTSAETPILLSTHSVSYDSPLLFRTTSDHLASLSVLRL